MNLNIGVIQKRSEPAFPSPRTVAAADEFASRIARRYLAGELTVSRAELALAYQFPDEINHFQESHLHIATQVTLHDHGFFAPVRREMAVASESPRETGGTQVTKLFERLFSRRARVASLQPNAPAIPPHDRSQRDQRDQRPLPGFAMAAPEPVARILRAVAPEPSLDRAAKPAATSAPAPDPGWGSPISLPAASKPFTLPAAEVKRVTEQVIREIDHRIIARRERMGKR
jgi:hypothetical protein